MSVTIISKNALLADGLSTVVFLMNKDKAIELLRQFPETEAIIYYRQDEDIISLKTKGLKKNLIKEYN